MDQSLRDAAQHGNIDALYALIRRDVKVLDRIDELPFVETPLHVAAFAGHTRFASEIMRLKPSFSRKRNEDGFTPIHLALQNNKTEVLRQLLDVDEDLVRLKGKEGVTSLHYVAQTGNLVLLAEFLNVCPKSIKDVTIRRDTAFHIALKNNQVDAFNILMKWYGKTRFNDVLASQNNQDKDVLLSGVGNLLNSKDEEGNTLLHIAISQNQSKVVRQLLNNVGVTINSENLEGCTIWQGQRPINSEMRRMLDRARVVLRLCPFRRAITHEIYLRSNFVHDLRTYVLLVQRGISNEWRSILLVVVVLYLTINFQLVLTPPGGLWQDNCDPQHNPVGNCTVPHQAGKVIMDEHNFQRLYNLNGISFGATIALLLLLLQWGSNPISWYCTLLCVIPMTLLYVCYFLSIQIVTPSSFKKQHRIWSPLWY